MGRKRSQYYINPKELISDIREYKETNVISDDLGKKLILLAERVASKSNFIEYAYNKEDCIGDAILRMVSQLNMINLDHPRCNPFSYLTQTCTNSFKARWNKELKYKKAKDSVTDYFFDELEQNEGISFKSNDE